MCSASTECLAWRASRRSHPASRHSGGRADRRHDRQHRLPEPAVRRTKAVAASCELVIARPGGPSFKTAGSATLDLFVWTKSLCRRLASARLASAAGGAWARLCGSLSDARAGACGSIPGSARLSVPRSRLENAPPSGREVYGCCRPSATAIFTVDGDRHGLQFERLGRRYCSRRQQSHACAAARA